jgi:hypothetical protein
MIYYSIKVINKRRVLGDRWMDSNRLAKVKLRVL